MKEKNKNLKEFVVEILRLVRDTGRTNSISISLIEELIVKHNINLRDLKDDV